MKAVVGVWLATIILALIVLLNPLQSFWTNGATLLGWILLSIQLTYNKSEKFYMFIKRVWFNFKNPDCIWDMNVVFKGEFDRKIFYEIEKSLNGNKEIKITQISNTRKLYRIGSISYEVFVNENNGELIMSVQKLQVSFRSSKRLIEQSIGKFLDNIRSIVKPIESEYGVTIEFSEFNPYYSLFLKRLKAEEIKDFSVVIKTDNNKVTVTNNVISLHSNDLWEMNSMSKKYLSLSPR